jgi:FkbM family methyltransferase
MLPEFKIYTNPNDIKFALYEQSEIISDEIKMRGLWNGDLVNYIVRVLSRQAPGNVIDVGAGRGSMVIPFAAFCNVQHTYHAFEPSRHLNLQLSTNVFLNHLSNVYVYQEALSDVEKRTIAGILDVWRLSNHGSFSFNDEVNEIRGIVSTPEKEFYKFKPLDSHGLRDIRFIKLSAPGMELEVLRGAKQTIENSGKPPICIEHWDYPWYEEKTKEFQRYLAEELRYASFDMAHGYFIAYKSDGHADFLTSEAQVEETGDFFVREKLHEAPLAVDQQKVYIA